MIVKDYILPFMIAFILTAGATPVVIPILRNLKASNTEREEGVQEHLKKAGTPTMGGLVFVVAIVLGSVFFSGKYIEILPVLFMTFAFGAIGFFDDYLKVVKHQSDGLLDYQKFGLQAAVTLLFAIYMAISKTPMDLLLPFSGKEWHIGFLAFPLMFFVVMGTVNGVNFTDGIDGLASTVTIVVAIYFALTASGLAPVSCAVIGALMGFLLYNCYPAQIFMGDTGSLALGGYVAAMAYMTQKPLYIIFIGIIYLAEVASVILQVSYFKMTGGKRIFKMAPIHHHFELSGWSETRVVAVFSIITAVMCVIML